MIKGKKHFRKTNKLLKAGNIYFSLIQVKKINKALRKNKYYKIMKSKAYENKTSLKMKETST